MLQFRYDNRAAAAAAAADAAVARQRALLIIIIGACAEGARVHQSDSGGVKVCSYRCQ